MHICQGKPWRLFIVQNIFAAGGLINSAPALTAAADKDRKRTPPPSL